MLKVFRGLRVKALVTNLQKTQNKILCLYLIHGYLQSQDDLPYHESAKKPKVKLFCFFLIHGYFQSQNDLH